MFACFLARGKSSRARRKCERESRKGGKRKWGEKRSRSEGRMPVCVQMACAYTNMCWCRKLAASMRVGAQPPHGSSSSLLKAKHFNLVNPRRKKGYDQRVLHPRLASLCVTSNWRPSRPLSGLHSVSRLSHVCHMCSLWTSWSGLQWRRRRFWCSVRGDRSIQVAHWRSSCRVLFVFPQFLFVQRSR